MLLDEVFHMNLDDPLQYVKENFITSKSSFISIKKETKLVGLR